MARRLLRRVCARGDHGLGNWWCMRIKDGRPHPGASGDDDVRGRDDPYLRSGCLESCDNGSGIRHLCQEIKECKHSSHILLFACTHWQLGTLLEQPLNNQPSKLRSQRDNMDSYGAHKQGVFHLCTQDVVDYVLSISFVKLIRSFTVTINYHSSFGL